MNGREQHKTGQTGGGGAERAQDAAGLALPFLASPQFPPGGCITFTEKTSAAAAAADAGLVFYYYGGHRIILEIDDRNRPAPLVASAEATGERGQSLLCEVSIPPVLSGSLLSHSAAV